MDKQHGVSKDTSYGATAHRAGVTQGTCDNCGYALLDDEDEEEGCPACGHVPREVDDRDMDDNKRW